MKSIKLFTIKKKTILAFLLCVLLICVFCAIYFPIQASASPKPMYTVVIDAGHGGIDGGSVGVVTKNDENHLNLEYAKCLREYLENFGVGVIFTRSTLDGLYSPSAKNKKKSDMQKRKEIIEKSGADIVVSIHMNSYPTRSTRGAQVFFAEGNQSGEALAKSIQKRLLGDIEHARKTPKAGDYFIVNCTTLPSVIVECGYLSNPEEDKLLSTAEHKEKVCYAIFCGIITFFGIDKI